MGRTVVVGRAMVGLVIVVSVGCSGGSDDSPARSTTTTTTLAEPVAASGEGGEVAVRPQAVGDDGLVVAEVTLEAPGFVAVFADGGGVPGELLGSSELLPAGTHEDVAVDVAVQESVTVFVVPFADTDGDGSLSWPEGDEALVGEVGVTVVEVPVDP